MGASVNRPSWNILGPASLDEFTPVSDGPGRILLLVGSPWHTSYPHLGLSPCIHVRLGGDLAGMESAKAKCVFAQATAGEAERASTHKSL